MELNLIVVFLYLLNISKFSNLKNKNLFEKLNDKFFENMKYIFEINIEEIKCNYLKNSKFFCEIVNIEQKLLDNYDCSFDYIIKIDKKETKNQYSNLDFLYKSIKFYINVFNGIISNIGHAYKFIINIFNGIIPNVCYAYKFINKFFENLFFHLKNMNYFLSQCLPINFKIGLNIIKVICKKEKSMVLFESNPKQTNIFVLYTLNFGLFFIIIVNNLSNKFSSLQPQKQNKDISPKKKIFPFLKKYKNNGEKYLQNNIFKKKYIEDSNQDIKKYIDLTD